MVKNAENPCARCLITGAAGFIGGALTLRLAKRDCHVIAVDRLDYCSSMSTLEPIFKQSNFKFIQGSVCERGLIDFILENEQIDTIVHLASQTHVDNSFGDSVTFTDDNVKGTHVLLESSRKSKYVKRFVHLSTDEVFGESQGRVMKPSNPYSATKAAAEMLVGAYKRSFGLGAIIVRSCNVYGPKQHEEKLIPKFLRMAREKERLPVHGTGECKRRFVFIDDVIDAVELITFEGEKEEEYNIVSEDELSVNEVAKRVCEMNGMDWNDKVEHVKDRPWNDRSYWMDPSSLAYLGWKQSTAFEDGLKRTFEWVNGHA